MGPEYYLGEGVMGGGHMKSTTPTHFKLWVSKTLQLPKKKKKNCAHRYCIVGGKFTNFVHL